MELGLHSLRPFLFSFSHLSFPLVYWFISNAGAFVADEKYRRPASSLTYLAVK